MQMMTPSQKPPTVGITIQTIIGLLLACTIGVLGWALRENYRLVSGEIDLQKAQIHEITNKLAERDVLFAEIRTNQAHMMETQKRIEDKLDRLMKERR